ncbi:MAG: glycosyltransferase family 4 protein, partial [Actinobacteria bacterium]|nr:glycosyltransferase family 4 protein [Actinomycetota bacterium]
MAGRGACPGRLARTEPGGRKGRRTRRIPLRCAASPGAPPPCSGQDENAVGAQRRRQDPGRRRRVVGELQPLEAQQNAGRQPVARRPAGWLPPRRLVPALARPGPLAHRRQGVERAEGAPDVPEGGAEHRQAHPEHHLHRHRSDVRAGAVGAEPCRPQRDDKGDQPQDPQRDGERAHDGIEASRGRTTLGRAVEAGLADRIQFLGFHSDVRRLLWAADALASPTRYEAYGLAVQEAVCCGRPVLVSEAAGVAERIGGEARRLLIADPNDAEGVAARLRAWRDGLHEHRSA